MKATVIEILKESGNKDVFSNELYENVKGYMNYKKSKDPQLKNLLSLDPYMRAKFVADHMVIFNNKSE